MGSWVRREAPGVCQVGGGQATHSCDLCLPIGPEQGLVALASAPLEFPLYPDMTIIAEFLLLVF